MSNPSVATPIANTIKSARSRELLKQGVRTLFLPLAGISIFLLVLPHFLGLNGVWLAVPAADLCALLLSLFLLREQSRSFAIESSVTPHTKPTVRPALKSGTADS